MIDRIALVANTWTDLSAYGKRFVVRPESGAVLQGSLKATAPTLATHTAAAGGAIEFILGGLVVKPWVRIVAGGYITIEQSGAPVVLTELSALADA
jgi:hypothetical protein